LRFAKYFVLFFFVVLIIISGCEPRGDVRGIREFGQYEAEPEIEVIMENGEVVTVMFEEYITGVVAGEMKENWPLNAYAAQAILARSFALRFLEEEDTNQIGGTYRDAQHYQPEKINDEIRQGVEKTRGEAIIHNDIFINGWFHANAGGQTTSAKVGLAYDKPEPPYTVSVESPDQEAPEDVLDWTVVFTDQEIEQILAEIAEEEIGNLEEINILDKDGTGRIIDLEFVGDAGRTEVHAAIFRRELDSKKLKSTMIDDIVRADEGFSFSGSGFGHGVGMSQWGAYSMAKQGRSPEEIVEHYFRNIEIVKVYD